MVNIFKRVLCLATVHMYMLAPNYTLIDLGKHSRVFTKNKLCPPIKFVSNEIRRIMIPQSTLFLSRDYDCNSTRHINLFDFILSRLTKKFKNTSYHSHLFFYPVKYRPRAEETFHSKRFVPGLQLRKTDMSFRTPYINCYTVIYIHKL